jgi:hypothetical protein
VISFYRGMQVGELALSDITPTNVLQQITHPFGDEDKQIKVVS